MYKPVLFEKDISSLPKPFRLNQKNYVLWKTKDGLYSMLDKCPHRAAKLSGGKVVGNTIECPYHGWRFDKHGICKRIPQLDSTKPIPNVCNIATLPVNVVDGIVWIGENDVVDDSVNMKFTKDSNCLVSNFYLEAPYSYYLQIENLLDPAHVHFVHDGFQGNRSKASTIVVKEMYENDTKLYGYFEHKSDTPDIEISFIKPYVVDISIRDKKSKKIMRKNVIYVSSIDRVSCNVLFRDIAFKDIIIPQDPFLKFHGELLLQGFSQNYQSLNTRIIDSIMEQDIQVLKGQQENIPSYLEEKYILPAECDVLISAFRKWCKNNVICV